MKLPIHWKKRPTGLKTSPSHSAASRSHFGGCGGGGAGWSVNWIVESAFSASWAAARLPAASAASFPCPAIASLPRAFHGATPEN
jgi:hypothetical protein